jgi:hypothetical protein
VAEAKGFKPLDSMGAQEPENAQYWSLAQQITPQDVCSKEVSQIAGTPVGVPCVAVVVAAFVK